MTKHKYEYCDKCGGYKGDLTPLYFPTTYQPKVCRCEPKSGFLGTGWKCPNCGLGVRPDLKTCPNCEPFKEDK